MSATSGLRPILASVATLILVAACGASGSSTAATAAPTAAASAGASGGEAYMVNVAQDAKLGAYLTGEDGKALYLFMKDSAGTTACTADCAAKWPPFLLDDGETAAAGTGVTGTIATFKRPDGPTQVTINGLPLYYFSGDSAAGQTNGQGFGGKWFLAGPDGKPVGAAPAGGSPQPQPSATYNY